MIPQKYTQDNFMVGARAGETVSVQNPLEQENKSIQVQVYLDSNMIFNVIQTGIEKGQLVLRQ